ncbi:MAG TPA: PEGA domain-containing protein [Vicinamibacterales bacterium]|nr:PEGA domain-containing protein [Vicinamibacterales bacterium]
MPTLAVAQWRYPPLYPPYGAYRYAEPESNLRVNVKPREASVYVDGYFAGKVEEFDGRMQRLHVLPGEHEIVVYLEGYRSLKQRLYLSPNATRTIDGSLEKLGPGDPPEPQPQPDERDRASAPPDEGYRQPPRGPVGRRGPADRPPPRRAPRAEPGEPSRFASLSIRVQPGGAVVRIDGERWDGPSGDERLVVQVTEGHHTIEVEREGYDRFTTEIDVRRGETTPVNISLRRR